jgi:hypothetical protein
MAGTNRVSKRIILKTSDFQSRRSPRLSDNVRGERSKRWITVPQTAASEAAFRPKVRRRPQDRPQQSA